MKTPRTAIIHRMLFPALIAVPNLIPVGRVTAQTFIALALALLALPAVVQAQDYDYTGFMDGPITITAYWGPGGEAPKARERRPLLQAQSAVSKGPNILQFDL